MISLVRSDDFVEWKTRLALVHDSPLDNSSDEDSSDTEDEEKPESMTDCECYSCADTIKPSKHNLKVQLTLLPFTISDSNLPLILPPSREAECSDIKILDRSLLPGNSVYRTAQSANAEVGLVLDIESQLTLLETKKLVNQILTTNTCASLLQSKDHLVTAEGSKVQSFHLFDIGYTVQLDKHLGFVSDVYLKVSQVSALDKSLTKKSFWISHSEFPLTSFQPGYMVGDQLVLEVEVSKIKVDWNVEINDMTTLPSKLQTDLSKIISLHSRHCFHLPGDSVIFDGKNYVIVFANTKAVVLWQSGLREVIDSTDISLCLNSDNFDFIPGNIVVHLPTKQRMVVTRVNVADQSVIVKLLGDKFEDQEEISFPLIEFDSDEGLHIGSVVAFTPADQGDGNAFKVGFICDIDIKTLKYKVKPSNDVESYWIKDSQILLTLPDIHQYESDEEVSSSGYESSVSDADDADEDLSDENDYGDHETEYDSDGESQIAALFYQWEKAPTSHLFYNVPVDNFNKNNFLRSLRQEFTLLRTIPNIQIHTFEDRLDLIVIFMKGINGSYQDILFEFHVKFEPDRTVQHLIKWKIPRHASLLSSSSIRWVNPNLLPSGEICWVFPDTEKPSLGQMVLCMQSSVLGRDVWWNDEEMVKPSLRDFNLKEHEWRSQRYRWWSEVSCLQLVHGQLQDEISTGGTFAKDFGCIYYEYYIQNSFLKHICDRYESTIKRENVPKECVKSIESKLEELKKYIS